MDGNKAQLSLVIPVYNAEKTIDELICEIESSLTKIDYIKHYEIVLVNDHSKDCTLKICKKICNEKKFVKLISFTKNFGQHNAILAGLKHTSGEFIVCLDDDLQTHPSQIKPLLDKLIEDDYDVVYAQYPDKKHNFYRNFGSFINDAMAKWLIDEPKDIKATSFLVARRNIIEEVLKHEGPYPYLSGLIFRTTQNVGRVSVEHYTRVHGKSNYTFRKLVRLLLNGFTNFSIKPLRLASVSGMIFAALSFLLSLFLIIKKIVNPAMQIGWTSIMLSIFFLGGIQLLGIGLLGEYIGRIYLSINGAPQYVIREKVNLDDEIH